MKDKARAQTDKTLELMEKEISRVYNKNPALISVYKEYKRYMDMVQERTEGFYKAYINESDKNIRLDNKKAYMDAIRALTIESADYRKLVKKIAKTITKVNKQALNIANGAMQEIYVTNYNQVAVDCEKVGIKVNGKK